jgi:hypothetical protein
MQHALSPLYIVEEQTNLAVAVPKAWANAATSATNGNGSNSNGIQPNILS